MLNLLKARFNELARNWCFYSERIAEAAGMLIDPCKVYVFSCRILNLSMDCIALKLEINGGNSTVKDGAKLFDNYIPCIEDKCNGKRAETF